MDSHQLAVSPLKNSVVSEYRRRNSSFSSVSEEEARVHRKETMVASMGVLEIFIHQARDIHNICIYQKQDVYAKLCLTSDPETTVSTQIINGGGQNPVFNESLRLTVKTTDSSLKCEIWMLSRVKNYLEDQLLGFAVVPLSDIFSENGRLEQDFSLSSNDLFHSPAGFVQLSISYSGESPEVMEIPTPRASLSSNTTLQDSQIPDTLQSHYDKIEFPDPDIANENNLMVSEYYGMSCSTLDSRSSESLSTSDANNNLASGVDAEAVQSFSSAISNPIEVTKNDAPASSVSTNGSPSVSKPASSQSPPDTPGVSKSSSQDVVSHLPENSTDVLKDESDSSDGLSSNKLTQTLTAANIVPQQIMVQQDIVDMYMKSMQQFTESLAKMKLPMDIENGTNSSGNTNSAGSDKKLEASKATGSRVFYGSRAFF